MGPNSSYKTTLSHNKDLGHQVLVLTDDKPGGREKKNENVNLESYSHPLRKTRIVFGKR